MLLSKILPVTINAKTNRNPTTPYPEFLFRDMSVNATEVKETEQAPILASENPEEESSKVNFQSPGIPSKKPIVRLNRNLYGHPLAGLYWEIHCHQKV